MSTVERARQVLTPEQAADFLQVDRETVYRYIRDGKLIASRLGRNYRITRDSLDTLLLATQTRGDIQLREYSPAQIAGFLAADRLDDEARAIAQRFMEANTSN